MKYGGKNKREDNKEYNIWGIHVKFFGDRLKASENLLSRKINCYYFHAKSEISLLEDVTRFNSKW